MTEKSDSGGHGVPVAVPDGVRRDFSMRRLSTLRIGGPADYFAEVGDEEALVRLLAWARTAGLAVGVVGSGSNLLIADDGFRGLVLKLVGSFTAIERNGSSVLCGGGARLPAVAAKTVRWGLAGIEFGINIPGSVGGSIKMNANAFGGELAKILEWAEIGDANGVKRFAPAALGFGYRSSSIGSDQIVTKASFRLEVSTSDRVDRGIKEVRAQRRESQPLGIQTLGSTFRNPDESIGQGERAAARLLSEAGCKELRVGNARFSPLHANFIQLDGPSTAAEVTQLLASARRRVHERFGVKLEPEVQVLGEVRWPDGWEL
jgi:UDP-N-acetylenolpyruvoylglucosamine reductase